MITLKQKNEIKFSNNKNKSLHFEMNGKYTKPTYLGLNQEITLTY